MSKWCLNCDEHIIEIFDPCPNCGMRPTDPSLRRGTSKAQYEREQGYHAHALSISNRSDAARGLHGDLLTNVPMLYGEPLQDMLVGDMHRKGMAAKNGGGLPQGSLESMSAYRLMWRAMWVLLVVSAIRYFIWE